MWYPLLVAMFCCINFILNSVFADPPKTPASSPARVQPEWITEIETATKARKDREQKFYTEYAARTGKAKTEAEQDALDKWTYEAGEEMRKANRTAAHSLMPLLRKHADDPKVYMGLAFATMYGSSDDQEEAGALMPRGPELDPLIEELVKKAEKEVAK